MLRCCVNKWVMTVLCRSEVNECKYTVLSTSMLSINIRRLDGAYQKTEHSLIQGDQIYTGIFINMIHSLLLILSQL